MSGLPKKIAVLMGGPGSERAVSLATGAGVVKALRSLGCEVTEVDVRGADFALPNILEPLAPVRSQVTVLSGLALDKARANGDGPGDHARAQASFLTGCQARKTAGADIRVGVSVDQLAAQRLGDNTRFPSLELGCEVGAQSGACDNPYSCAYTSNLAWKSESTPLPPEPNPRRVFERLFPAGRGAAVGSIFACGISPDRRRGPHRRLNTCAGQGRSAVTSHPWRGARRRTSHT